MCASLIPMLQSAKTVTGARIMQPYLSQIPAVAVLIPAWNERDNLELLLPSLKAVIAGLGLTADIVVVDGGSHDGTRETAARWGVRVVLQQERGYGGALLAGFAAS